MNTEATAPLTEEVKPAENVEAASQQAEAAKPEPTPEQVESEKAERARRRTQERIDRLTREKYELKGRLEALESRVRPQQEQSQGVDPSQFQSDADYIKALVQEERNQIRRQEEAARAERAHQEIAQKSTSILEDAAKLGGFSVDDYIPLPPVFSDVVLESDHSAKIVAYLQNNPKEIDRISSLSPSRQAMEVGKLEDKIQGMSAKKSSTPAPIKPVGVSSGTVPLDKLSTAEFIARRNEAQYKRR